MAIPDQVIYSTQDVGNRRHCNGNPNTVGVYGEPGWTCQDWTNGQLYVFGETTGPYGWMPVLRNENPSSPSSDGQIFTNNGGYAQWSYQITNATGSVMAWSEFGGLTIFSQVSGSSQSANFDYRVLIDNNAEYTLNWVICQLIDPVTVNRSLDWVNRAVYDGSNVQSINWNSRLLIDEYDQLSINWLSRNLLAQSDGGGNSYTLLQWSNEFVTRRDTGADSNNNPYFTNQTAPMSACGTQRYVPASGATVNPVTDTATDLTVFIDTAATLASLTVTLATWLNKAPDGARVTIFTRSALTSLTVTATGYTVYGAAVTTLAAGASIEYVKSNATSGTVVTRTGYSNASAYLLRVR